MGGCGGIAFIYDLYQLFHFDVLVLESHISVNSPIYLNFQNGFANFSGIAYLSDIFLYAKRTVGPPISAQNCSINTDGDIKENKCHIIFETPCIKNQL